MTAGTGPNSVALHLGKRLAGGHDQVKLLSHHTQLAGSFGAHLGPLLTSAVFTGPTVCGNLIEVSSKVENREAGRYLLTLFNHKSLGVK